MVWQISEKSLILILISLILIKIASLLHNKLLPINNAAIVRSMAHLLGLKF